MPKNLIKKYLPDPDFIKEHKNLRIFGELLHNANLWHLNRRSAAGAFAVGIFMAFVPVPFQMLLAAGAAILLKLIYHFQSHLCGYQTLSQCHLCFMLPMY
eukprot:TRINITY_DN2794_c0_g1_i1.p1 TRINITY_DN2794_c0_g1~~TRINITY_DN2794_c0_g1_i1.p1  ORF type:complete len:100 (-),score=0.93 TRINITY_DN2794_c0_g1_i1:149-448(-)